MVHLTWGLFLYNVPGVLVSVFAYWAISDSIDTLYTEITTYNPFHYLEMHKNNGRLEPTLPIPYPYRDVYMISSELQLRYHASPNLT